MLQLPFWFGATFEDNLNHAMMPFKADLLCSWTSNRGSSATAGRVAFVQSSGASDIVDQCRLAFLAELGRLGRAATSIGCIEVPGAFEIRLQAELLASNCPP